jgi:hypothetical protein
MDLEVQDFCQEIVDCLIEYGKVEEAVARHLVDASKVCECVTDLDKDLLFHETPYYWAMRLLHSSNNPEWYQDSKLWPPPQEYLDKWYPRKA